MNLNLPLISSNNNLSPGKKFPMLEQQNYQFQQQQQLVQQDPNFYTNNNYNSNNNLKYNQNNTEYPSPNKVNKVAYNPIKSQNQLRSNSNSRNQRERSPLGNVFYQSTQPQQVFNYPSSMDSLSVINNANNYSNSIASNSPISVHSSKKVMNSSQSQNLLNKSSIYSRTNNNTSNTYHTSNSRYQTLRRSNSPLSKNASQNVLNNINNNNLLSNRVQSVKNINYLRKSLNYNNEKKVAIRLDFLQNFPLEFKRIGLTYIFVQNNQAISNKKQMVKEHGLYGKNEKCTLNIIDYLKKFDQDTDLYMVLHINVRSQQDFEKNFFTFHLLYAAHNEYVKPENDGYIQIPFYFQDIDPENRLDIKIYMCLEFQEFDSKKDLQKYSANKTESEYKEQEIHKKAVFSEELCNKLEIFKQVILKAKVHLKKTQENEDDKKINSNLSVKVFKTNVGSNRKISPRRSVLIKNSQNSYQKNFQKKKNLMQQALITKLASQIQNMQIQEQQKLQLQFQQQQQQQNNNYQIQENFEQNIDTQNSNFNNDQIQKSAQLQLQEQMKLSNLVKNNISANENQNLQKSQILQNMENEADKELNNLQENKSEQMKESQSENSKVDQNKVMDILDQQYETNNSKFKSKFSICHEMDEQFEQTVSFKRAIYVQLQDIYFSNGESEEKQIVPNLTMNFGILDNKQFLEEYKLLFIEGQSFNIQDYSQYIRDENVLTKRDLQNLDDVFILFEFKQNESEEFGWYVHQLKSSDENSQIQFGTFTNFLYGGPTQSPPFHLEIAPIKLDIQINFKVSEIDVYV